MTYLQLEMSKKIHTREYLQIKLAIDRNEYINRNLRVTGESIFFKLAS